MNPNGNGNNLTCTNCWEMRAHKQVFQEIEKKRENMRKHYRSKKSFSYEIYARTSKATHRVSQLRVCLLLGSFPFFITCSSLHRNYDLRLGVSSNRHIMVNLQNLDGNQQVYSIKSSLPVDIKHKLDIHL